MSWGEVLFRVEEQADLLALYVKYRLGGIRDTFYSGSNSAFCSSSETLLPRFKWSPVPEDAVAAALARKINLYDKDWYWQLPDTDSCWHTAPENGYVWPQKFFHGINFRAGNEYGDIRIAWEASRFQHLITLALIAVHSENESPRQQAIGILSEDLLEWHRQNPAAQGIHYVSSMECALRIIALVLALDMLRDQLQGRQQVWNTAAQLVVEHADFITKRLSLHSSAGNHTLAESLGLVVAGLCFAEHPKAKKWLSLGVKIFPAEFCRQVDDSGYGIEQGSTYLLQILDYGVLFRSLLEHNGIEVAADMSSTLDRGLACARSMKSAVGTYPVLGDSDSGFAVSPYFVEVLGVPVAPLPEYSNSSLTAYSAPGYSLSLVFDHGPLGMAPSYGHGHADAISLCLYKNKAPLFIDAGTYSYTGHPDWRMFFRSTAAHNTVRVDGQEQAYQKLIFMWSRPFECELLLRECNGDANICVAQHSGYQHLGVVHRRAVIFVPNRGVCVRDFLFAEDEHHYDLNWHYRRVVNNVDELMADAGLFFSIEGGDLSLVSGGELPGIGWRSERYESKEPITTLVCSQVGQAHQFTTWFLVNEQARGDFASALGFVAEKFGRV